MKTIDAITAQAGWDYFRGLGMSEVTIYLASYESRYKGAVSDAVTQLALAEVPEVLPQPKETNA